MFRAIIHWLLSAIALMVATSLVPGFYVNDIQSALIAALVIGVLNATLGFILKVLTFPFAIVTFGLFLLVINAAMILLAAKIVTGFVVYGWVPALWAALILAIVGMLIRALMKDQ
ncbi:MAG TPA: phage holin family protein [Terracidiphilus sp.]|jgi:putative membrane protein